MKNNKSITDLILTNKPLHFQKTHAVETGLKLSRLFSKHVRQN